MTLRHLTKVGVLVLAMSVMASFSLWALVQKIDYTTEQYVAYNECANLTDPEAKQKCVLDFMRHTQSSRLWGMRLPNTAKHYRSRSRRGSTSKLSRLERRCSSTDRMRSN